MPIYTYACKACKDKSDYLVKFSDPVPPCKACGSGEQEKQLSSGTSVCLMGYGWSSPGFTGPK